MTRARVSRCPSSRDADGCRRRVRIPRAQGLSNADKKHRHHPRLMSRGRRDAYLCLGASAAHSVNPDVLSLDATALVKGHVLHELSTGKQVSMSLSPLAQRPLRKSNAAKVNAHSPCWRRQLNQQPGENRTVSTRCGGHESRSLGERTYHNE